MRGLKRTISCFNWHMRAMACDGTKKKDHTNDERQCDNAFQVTQLERITHRLE